MKKFWFLTILVPLIGAVSAVQADPNRNPLVVTASNATQNQLLVYDSGGELIQTIATKAKAASAVTPEASKRMSTWSRS